MYQGESVKTERLIYTPSSFARQSLFHLQEIGELQALKPHTSRREDLTSLLFFYVVTGNGTLMYDNTSYALSAGDCVFIDCRRPYLHTCGNGLWKLKWIHFHGPSCDVVYEKYKERGGLAAFHTEHPDEYLRLWTSLFAVASSNDHVRDMRINEHLSALLTLLMIESWHPSRQQSGIKQSSVTAVESYLRENYKKRIVLDELADQFFINKFYLSRSFKKQYGISLWTYLLQLRITEAKTQLRFTDKTIEQIALDCGFEELNYFSRIFRKIEGISPSEYRRKW